MGVESIEMPDGSRAWIAHIEPMLGDSICFATVLTANEMIHSRCRSPVGLSEALRAMQLAGDFVAYFGGSVLRLPVTSITKISETPYLQT